MNKKTVQSAHDRIDALEKQIIEIKTEMKTFEDVKNTIEHILSFLNLDYTIDENLTQNIETFLYRQQSLIASEHWPHLSY